MRNVFVNIKTLIPSRSIHLRTLSEGEIFQKELFTRPLSIPSNTELANINSLSLANSWLDWVSEKSSDLKVPPRWVSNAEELRETMEAQVIRKLNKQSWAGLEMTSENSGQFLNLSGRYLSKDVCQ